MNVIIYTRPNKLEQLEKCKAYAAENEMNVVAVKHEHNDLFTEKGVDAILVSSMRGLDNNIREAALISALITVNGLKLICVSGNNSLQQMEFTTDTIIVTKEGWELLTNKRCVQRGFNSKTEETLERLYNRISIKNGAGDEYPTAVNEIRIDKLSIGFTIKEIKKILEENNLPYRQDGYKARMLNLL